VVDHIFTTAIEPIILNYYNGTNIDDQPLSTIEEAIVKFYLGMETQGSGVLSETHVQNQQIIREKFLRIFTHLSKYRYVSSASLGHFRVPHSIMLV